MPKKRGRRKGKETVPMTALLYPEQKAKLEYLSENLTGNPKVAGLLRQAVDEFLERHFTTEHAADFDSSKIASEGGSAPSESLRLVR
jgi:hypothetical protein